MSAVNAPGLKHPRNCTVLSYVSVDSRPVLDLNSNLQPEAKTDKQVLRLILMTYL